jgi:outer membrane biosynthesis protein TonB
MAVCAVLLIGGGILAILDEPKIEPPARPTQPTQPGAQSTEPPVKQEVAQTESTEPPVKQEVAQTESTEPPVKQEQAQTESTEPPVKQEQAQTEPAKLTEPAKPTEPPAKRDLRDGDHATVKMNTLACKTMAYFDRWVALKKANDDETAKKFTLANLGDCSVMSKGDEVIVEQLGRIFLYNACVRKRSDIDCRWLRLSMLEAIK